jgi:hypothetical protein
VTPEDRQVIYDLVFIPGRGRKGSPEDVLRHFGRTDGHALGLSLLTDAVAREDGDDAEAALTACFVFGMTLSHLPLLVLLASADWHCRHEDVAGALDGLRTPGAVDALYHLTQWVPDYLAWDEDRGLARKAVWGLAKTPGPRAEQALRLLLDDPDETVRAYAAKGQSRRDQSLAPASWRGRSLGGRMSHVSRRRTKSQVKAVMLLFVSRGAEGICRRIERLASVSG